MIMQMDNRLIDDFWKQTDASIWKHMRAMAVNYAVYSNHLRGIAPFLNENDVYFYVSTEAMVVVCVDCNQQGKRSYEESDGMNALIYRKGAEPQESMVWKLKETLRIIERRLEGCKFDLKVYGLLLTEAEITNAYYMEDTWEKQHIKVIDSMMRLRYKRAEVNNDEDMMMERLYFTVATDAMLDTELQKAEETPFPPLPAEEPKETEQTEDDEFDRLLDEFINKDYSVVDEEEPDDEENTTDNEDDDDMDDDLDDILIPSGEIEQNQNISVKVEILRPIAHPREELEKLVGCADIKRRMDELVALTSYNKMMHEAFPDSKQHEVSLHSVFLGRPGTGKTTVCKIFGSLLRQAGALSKGHVVVCDRGTFIGTLWGDEERSMRQVLEMAKGGVLMIDEAYLLNGKHDNDPGKLVIQLLMNILADETQRDIAVVLCGYKTQMLKLLDMNPGLQSRFPNRFEFQDFTIDELLEITQRRVRCFDYQFTTTAWEKYSGMLSQAYQVRDPESWGNARFVGNLLERIYIQHAARCVRQQPQDKQQLRLITPEDIVPIEIPRPKAKIGF